MINGSDTLKNDAGRIGTDQPAEAFVEIKPVEPVSNGPFLVQPVGHPVEPVGIFLLHWRKQVVVQQRLEGQKTFPVRKTHAAQR